MTNTILVLSGGGPAPTTPLPAAQFVIAADSGMALAAALDLRVDLVVGDLDSIEAADLDRARSAGARIETHPVAKDATDLELALEAAIKRQATRIVVAGGGAGRLDHLLGLAMLLTDPRWAAVELEWHAGTSVAHVVRNELVIDPDPGTIVSMVPVSDDAVVSIRGTRWELDGAALPRGTTRGISNLAIDPPVEVAVSRGVVLVILEARP